MWIQGLSSLGQLPLPSEKSQKISHSYQVMVSTQTSLTCSRNDSLLPQSLLYNIISSKLAEAFTLTSLHAKLNDYQDNLAFLKVCLIIGSRRIIRRWVLGLIVSLLNYFIKVWLNYIYFFAVVLDSKLQLKLIWYWFMSLYTDIPRKS